MKPNDFQLSMLRTLIRTAAAEGGYTIPELADELFPQFSRPNVYRILGDEPRCSRPEIVLGALAPLLNFDAGRAAAVLASPYSSDLLPEAEMASSVTYMIDRDGTTALAAAVDAAARQSSRVLVFAGSMLPPFLLEEDLIGTATAYDSPNGTAKTLGQVRASRRELFMNNRGIASVPEIVVPTTVSALARLLAGRRPYRGVELDVIDETFESLKHDALNRNVRLATLSDVTAGAAQQWAWAHGGFAAIAVFDCGLLVTRRRRSRVYRMVRADRDPVSRHVFDCYLRDMECAATLSCHGAQKAEIAGFLDQIFRLMRRKDRPSQN